jgi:hypothetical protein
VQAHCFAPADIPPECLAVELHRVRRLAAEALCFLERAGYTGGGQHSAAGNTQNAIVGPGGPGMENGDAWWLVLRN